MGVRGRRHHRAVDDHQARGGLFPAALLSSIVHEHDLRTRFHAQKDLLLNAEINGFYRTAKNDLLRQNAILDLAARRQLYANVRSAFSAPGGIATFQIPFRDTVIQQLGIKATLRYDLTRRDSNLSRPWAGTATAAS